jgi:hypothetical protein
MELAMVNFRRLLEGAHVHHCYIQKLLDFELARLSLAWRKRGYQLYMEAHLQHRASHSSTTDLRNDIFKGVIGLGKMEFRRNRFQECLQENYSAFKTAHLMQTNLQKNEQGCQKGMAE